MVRTSRTKSVNSDEKSKSSRGKIQDGGRATDGSDASKQTPVVKDKHTHSPLNRSGARRLPDIPSHSTPKHSDVVEEGPVCVSITCRRDVLESENAVCCNKCHRWAHQACAGFNQSEYKLLTKKGKNQENLMWFCDACTPLIRCFLLGKPQSPLHSPKTQVDLDKKLDKIMAGFSRMEEALSKKEERLEEMIEDKVAKYLSEQKERSGREQNVIFHNVPESTSEDVEERKTYDKEQVEEIISFLEVEDSEIGQTVRLGKKDTKSERPRLLKVTLGSTNTKKETMTRAKNLRKSTGNYYNKVFITPDLTYKEREENRKLRQKLAERRAEGESELVIKNGRITRGSKPFRERSEDKGSQQQQKDK